MNDNQGDRGQQPPQDLAVRTKAYACRIVRLYGALPKSVEAQVIGKQLLRSGTSVGAHYREGKRARSNAEFVSKLDVGLQELEETSYWLELLIECDIISSARLGDLISETQELIAIFVTVIRNAKKKR